MRMRYPLEPEDVMKLLDKAFDKAVAATKPVKAIAEGLTACATALEKMASNLAAIAHNQAVHHHMITQMWGVHQVILKKLNDNSLDTSMPGLKDDKEKSKPN